MKKKILLSITMFGLLMGLGITKASAADETTSSEASVTFTAGAITPVDPVDPDNPDNPGVGPGTGMNGPLSLDYVPTMDFGSNEITGSVETYNLTDLKPYIQVTDNRGTGAGWKVSVSLSKFENNDQSKSFDGVLNFTNPSVVTTTGNLSGAPTPTADVSVTSGAAEQKLIGTVNAGEGMGTWVNRWYQVNAGATNDAVKLTVNTANVLAESYKADLAWMISNAP